MGEICHGLSVTSPSALDALALETWQLEPPMPHERSSVLRSEAALLIDGLLARVAPGRGALDVAMGEGLAALAEGDRTLRLGYSGIGDYARERLGVAGRTAQAMARLARELRTRPLLREAVRRGEVSARKAQAVLPLARGEAEEQWVARARAETVRALEAAVRAAGAAQGEEEEDWERICVPLSPEGRARLDEAMALAGKLLGAAAPQWQRLEAVCQEFLGAHPPDGAEVPGEESDQVLRGPVAEWLESAKEALEAETGRWEVLGTLAPVEAPAARESETDPRRIDEELRRLAAMRDRWDELLGHLAMLRARSGSGRISGSPPSPTTAPSGWGWPSARWSSAPGSSAGSMRSRRCAGPCARGASPTRRRGWWPAAPPTPRSTPGSSGRRSPPASD